ncbi:MAG: hypothetical protein KIT08_01480 [Anaerolineales bacterium]|nr:MAG: hypothetical protein KIT08_01480 [Anaerolineales bacterium]
MTDKTTAWFDEVRAKFYHRKDGGRQRPALLYRNKRAELLAVLGRVFYTNARINGKSKRVRVWIP